VRLGDGLAITWLGHACFLVETPGGKRIVFDPWTTGNPACPDAFKHVDRADVILPSHAHFDHIGDLVEIARTTNAQVPCIWELSVWLESQGIKSAIGMNKGGTVEVAGLRCTMVHADHSSGILSDGAVSYGGEPAGWVVELENGKRLYHAGDTNVFGDMRLIGELYKPDVALLPIGGHFTMGPVEAATATRLLGVKLVIPMHYGTFPVLAGRPEQLREHLKDKPVDVLEMRPGETLR